MPTEPLVHLVPASAFDAEATVPYAPPSLEAEVRPYAPGRGGRWSRPDVAPLP